MKQLIIIMVLILTMALGTTALPPENKVITPDRTLAIDNVTYINSNNILMFVTNHGNFGRDLMDVFGMEAGTFFPYTTNDAILNGPNNKFVNFASGLWVGGLVNYTIRVALAEYVDEYVPGYMENGTYAPNSMAFKVYKLFSDSLADNPNSDFNNWPYYQGAPWRWNPDIGKQVPDMIGDQMLWSVYNDANPVQHANNAGNTDPLGIEIRQTTWAHDMAGPLGNIIFLRYRIFNKGDNIIENCYFSLWADPDLGGASDDLVGCDPEKQLGFVYNATNSDISYGSKPPSMGYDFLQGPIVPSPGDTARMWGELWPDMKNLGMVSFNRYINGTDPSDIEESYNYMQGLKANGEPYIFNGVTTLFQRAGDPVAGTGDIDTNPADRRFMQSTGPITFAPGDSTEIIAAIIIGQGTNRLTSITTMKAYDLFAQAYYDSITEPDIPTAIEDPKNELPNGFVLAQNYPNPFNPTTRISYTIPYGEQVKISVFNVMGQSVKILTNSFQPAGSHSVEWDATNDSGEEVAGGIYLYRIQAGDFKTSRKMLLIK